MNDEERMQNHEQRLKDLEAAVFKKPEPEASPVAEPSEPVVEPSVAEPSEPVVEPSAVTAEPVVEPSVEHAEPPAEHDPA